MDAKLANKLVDRDWPMLVRQARLLGLGEPVRDELRIDLRLAVGDAADAYLAVLLCDGYDALAPVLDFADPEHPDVLGAPFWPRFSGAPMNSIEFDGRTLPILCTPGTRGYHLHSSHVSETFPREAWRLPVAATLIHRLVTGMGDYLGRGV